MRLSRQFQVCLFFLRLFKVSHALKPLKRKTSAFNPLRNLCAQKIVVFVISCLLNFVLLVNVCLWVFLCARNLFVIKKKRNTQAWNLLDYWANGHFFWYRECYGCERAFFYFQAFFTLHSFLLVSSPPQDRLFNLKVSRASCWSSKHSPGPAICLNHNNQQKRCSSGFYLWFMTGWLE